MLSIGQFANLTQVSSRTIRYYESIGLISSASRGENNYRYYNPELVGKVTQIRDLQALGFTLDEVKVVLKISQGEFTKSLQKKLEQVIAEVASLTERKERIENLLSVSKKIELGELINDTEREQFMMGIKEEIIHHLKAKLGYVTETQLAYLNRDEGLYNSPEKIEFIEAIKKCVEFAKKNNLSLGPARGSGSASLVLYSLGFGFINPIEHQLIPERISIKDVDIHIDVEYERGQEFVDYCRDLSGVLKFGEINAFKMPLLDIINNVHKRIGHEIDYNAIDENSDLVLKHFRTGDIEKIFLFDLSKEALIMYYENFLPEYVGIAKMKEYVRSQKIESFRDVINIAALWRPFSNLMVERIAKYKEAKLNPMNYDFLTPDLQASLQSNYGMILYHEDILRIMATYTGWNYERCNQLRRGLNFPRHLIEVDLLDFRQIAPPEVVELVLRENPSAFCLPHAISHANFTKQTAILKSLHPTIYYEEIEKFEQKHGLKYDDIGMRSKGISLLQI